MYFQRMFVPILLLSVEYLDQCQTYYFVGMLLEHCRQKVWDSIHEWVLYRHNDDLVGSQDVL